jgi:fructose-specific phosphotransferase system IIC component
LFDYVFAVIHLLALVALLGYAVFSLATGAYFRGALIIGLLAAYYLFVLRDAVRKEMDRKKRLKAGKRT